jgi:O-antigen/teichoic acid export membrane protein
MWLSEASHPLTRRNLLVKNALWNIAGQVSPLMAAVFSIPILITHLGTTRFGILTLIWMVIGYASVFDLGLSRALTQMIAKRLGHEPDANDLASLGWTGLTLMTVLGGVGGLLLAVLSPWLVQDILRIPHTLQPETLNSFLFLAAYMPALILSIGLRGILEAYQDFGMINVVRAPLGLFNFVAPLLILPFSKDLSWIVALLILGRLVSTLFYLKAVYRRMTGPLKLDWSHVGPMLTFGGWMTVSNLISPLMVYMDRFVIAAWVSIHQVAYYTTPFEIITKVLILPVGLVGVMFPAFGTELIHNRPRAQRLYERSVKIIFAVVLPVVLLAIGLARPGLGWWLSPQFAEHSYRVGQILCLGVLFNSLAQPAFALIQASGRPDLTAKLHLFEMPLYAVALALLIPRFGLEGVAWAWTLRTAMDCLLLGLIARQLLSETPERARYETAHTTLSS